MRGFVVTGKGRAGAACCGHESRRGRDIRQGIKGCLINNDFVILRREEKTEKEVVGHKKCTRNADE